MVICRRQQKLNLAGLLVRLGLLALLCWEVRLYGNQASHPIALTLMPVIVTADAARFNGSGGAAVVDQADVLT